MNNKKAEEKLEDAYSSLSHSGWDARAVVQAIAALVEELDELNSKLEKQTE